MRAVSLLLTLTLLGLFTGCAQVDGKGQQITPADTQESYPEREAPQSQVNTEDTEIDSLLQEIQMLDEFLGEIEGIDSIEAEF